MSDEMREDTPVDETATGDTLEGKTRTDDGAVETPSLIFGKFNSMDAAEKGHKELEQKLHSLAQEKADLAERAQMASALEKLADAQASSSQVDNSDELFKAKLAEIAEDYREQPEVALEKHTALTNAWIADEGRKLKDSISKEIEIIKADNATLRDRLGDMNPDYIENKDTVDSLVADGMPKAKAIEWAKKMAPKESRVLPTSMNGTVKREGEARDSYLSKEERERFKTEMGLSDEDLDGMEAEAKARHARGGRLPV